MHPIYRQLANHAGHHEPQPAGMCGPTPSRSSTTATTAHSGTTRGGHLCGTARRQDPTTGEGLHQPGPLLPRCGQMSAGNTIWPAARGTTGHRMLHGTTAAPTGRARSVKSPTVRSLRLASGRYERMPRLTFTVPRRLRARGTAGAWPDRASQTSPFSLPAPRGRLLLRRLESLLHFRVIDPLMEE